MRYILKTKYIYFVVYIFCIIFVYFLHRSNVKTNLPKSNKNLKQRPVFSRKTLLERLSRKSYFQNDLILFYTAYYGKRPWTRHFIDKQAKCRIKIPCDITYDKDRFVDSRAVIFHAPDRPSLRELDMLRNHPIRKDQIWVYFTMENPYHVKFHQNLDGMFNFTMSYRLNSDIYFPYRHYFRVNDGVGGKAEVKHEFRQPSEINYAANKTRQIAWLVSNCRGLREKFVYKLQEHSLDIAVGGKCRKHFEEQLECKGYLCSDTLRQFKFYLSLESDLCNDYVTEKYWLHPLQNNMIPIVLGGANYNNPRLAIPGSFVNVFDFKTMESLANFIKTVDANDTMFNSFFEWREKWRFYSEEFECNESINDLCTKMKNETIHEKIIDYQSFSEELKKDKEKCHDRSWIYQRWLAS